MGKRVDASEVAPRTRTLDGGDFVFNTLTPWS